MSVWGGYVNECMCGVGMRVSVCLGWYVSECMCGVGMRVSVCVGWVSE